SYKEWADYDIAKWKELGAKKADLVDAVKGLSLFPGALETIDTLKKRGMKIAIISGSLSIVLDVILPHYRKLFDEVYIPILEFKDDGTIGDIFIPEFAFHDKTHALLEICEKLDITPDETAFIGDHENDIEVLRRAGMGIAFNSKLDSVKEAADRIVNIPDLRAILPHVLKKKRGV
ncbi:MAG: HAD-IB family phosphatase, partial [Nanoarchaeota archaeon]